MRAAVLLQRCIEPHYATMLRTRELTCQYRHSLGGASVHGSFTKVGGVSNITLLLYLVTPVWGRGTPFPLVHLLPHLFPLLLFSFFLWLYLFSSLVHPLHIYQNSPTPFPGRRS